MIVDDIESIGQYFESIISNQPDMEVVATAGSGFEAVEKFKKNKFDIILIEKATQKTRK